MNALDSPLEALALNYLSYGLLTVVNSIWTWVAVLTAAVSFWRIRASSEHPRGRLIHGSSPCLLLSSPEGEKVAVGEPNVVPKQEEMTCSPKTMQFCGLDKEESTKGKFTLYYWDEGESEKCGISDNHRARLLVPSMDLSGYEKSNHRARLLVPSMDVSGYKKSEKCGISDNQRARLLAPSMDVSDGNEFGEGWWSKWEMVMKMRKGDDEWYSCQDMNLINGNVVRLWDGCRRLRNEVAPLELAVVGDLMWW